MKLAELFTITKDHVVAVFAATRSLDAVAQDALKGDLSAWFADLPHSGGAYMFRDVVTALRANGDATTAAEITKLWHVDGAISAGKAPVL
ncbi:hypothetical protein PXK30_09455 [Phaeobacter gallaeciensis]|uniref:hypothetical protein n=1 Tax=Phaeobacter gallaeciensis TaxID=60890 RepID=UPI00237FC49D|nr:hypothetical protein [Phaeobacter gallaeciensis]MDE4303652.1 hypothetical protein [Phaeobacter gallaeciensis]MDE4307867.1 hypothetical protein [Phaeobacter gallaeciensis]MDE4312325.1 hypothetical protein [Phaeobacter gallaeciensis]MDE4316796.1 hypothetical protein [Phaeobacter gallaeciensis]MDE4321259.1 hypothetical protein [Phaeobacter gallaeciensis]